MKQVIIFRTDLKMGKGKIAAQAAHASVGAMKKAGRFAVKRWELGGSKKVVLKVKSLRSLKSIHRKACRKLPCFMVKDAGRTQIRSGTVTCLGIGPAKDEDIDAITSKLKLL